MTSPDLPADDDARAPDRPDRPAGAPHRAPGAHAAEPRDDGGYDGGYGDGPGGGLLPDGDAPAGRRRKKRWPRVLIAFGVFVALLLAGVGGLLWQRSSAYDDNIDRVPSALPTGPNRPGPGAVGTENWLLVGSDTRAKAATTGGGEAVWKPGAQRSDTIMLLHLPADRKKAYVISFPRDSWVQVRDYGPSKINAAFSYGGPPLLTETVESLTGIRVDHFGAIDFNGFKSMTDALGGVEVTIKEDVYDPARKTAWTAGKHKLNGEDALNFVRQRYNLPNGDFDRIKRQQAFLGALAKKAADGGTVSNPLKLNRFLSAFTKSISVDSGVKTGDLRSLAFSLRGIRSSDVVFLTVPNKGSASRAKQSVVLLDRAKAGALFEAVKTSEVAEYVATHGGQNRVGTVS
ncbi:LCP family protein [Actinomadura flavalba]|uniref:LCP family protein n=1 Tax=Actinomadura flavalba TaxID=1120938 RepID=UPI000364BBA3|nr:LCP family protein [Actinomadura flavalba]